MSEVKGDKHINFAKKLIFYWTIFGFGAHLQNAHSQTQPQAAPASNSYQFKVRTYATIPIAHGFGIQPDLKDTSPGYGGKNVSYDVLEKNDKFERVIITHAECLVNPGPGEQCLQKDGEYYVAANIYKLREIRDGIVSGILAVPFKYHFTDHAVTAGATIGAYIGYEKDYSWIGSAALVIGGGLALIPTNTTTTNFSPNSGGQASQTTTTTADSTINGVTIATGAIFRIGQTNAQFGVLTGVDLANKNHNYKYDGKPWLSFSFAYAFSGNK